MANTLLSYFKDNLKSQGCTPKYLNRAFLAAYINAYNARKRNIEQGIYNEYGTPEYEYNAVFNTDFYTKNSSAYCAFIELWHGYKRANEFINSKCRADWEQLAVQTAQCMHDLTAIEKYRYD